MGDNYDLNTTWTGISLSYLLSYKKILNLLLPTRDLSVTAVPSHNYQVDLYVGIDFYVCTYIKCYGDQDTCRIDFILFCLPIRTNPLSKAEEGET